MLACSGIPAKWFATIDLLGAQGPFTARPKGRRALIFGLRLLSPSGADNDRCNDRKEKSFHCFLVVARAGHDAIVARTRSDDSCIAAVTPPTWDEIVCSRCATPPALRARLPIVHCSEIILAEQHTPVATYFQRADCSKIRHGDHCAARHIVHIERCFGRNDSDRSPFPSPPSCAEQSSPTGGPFLAVSPRNIHVCYGCRRNGLVLLQLPRPCQRRVKAQLNQIRDARRATTLPLRGRWAKSTLSRPEAVLEVQFPRTAGAWRGLHDWRGG